MFCTRCGKEHHPTAGFCVAGGATNHAGGDFQDTRPLALPAKTAQRQPQPGVHTTPGAY